MKGRWPSFLVLATVATSLAAPAGETPDATARHEIDFARDIRPILARCATCHGPDEAARQAGLRLDTADGATATLRGNRRAIVPGRAHESVILERLAAEDPDRRMPPPEAGPPLAPHEVDLVRRWIDSGAAYETHWAFLPPARRTPPGAEHDRPIDRFIAARLDEVGLAPSPAADRTTLARRVSLDLIGLPPTPEEVDAFVADDRPDAYERFVDRLLASPHFGERWASVWLDLARYADTKGYEADRRRTIWPYRDWVIDAYNNDLPYDQFTNEQIAGDLLPDATQAQLVATAFHRNTMTNDEGGTDDEEFRVAAVVDRVNTTMQVWMGLSMGCAQCHSHKYDPLSHREYYELFAFFNQSEDADRMDEAPLLAILDEERTAEIAALRKTLAERHADVARLKTEAEARREVWEQTVLARSASTPSEGLHHYEGLEVVAEDVDAITSARGIVGEGVTLAGAGMIDLGVIGDFEHTQAFSVGAWIHPDTNETMVPFARMDVGEAYRGYDLFIHEGRPYVHIIHRWPESVIRVNTANTLPIGDAAHVMITYDGSGSAAGATIYVNGRPGEMEITHDTLDGSIRTERPFLIGRRYGERFFHGRIDELRLYDRALAADEVRTLIHGDLAAHLVTPEVERDAEVATLIRATHLALDGGDYDAARREVVALERDITSRETGVPRIPIMRELPSDQHRTTHVLLKGHFLSPAETVEPGVPSVLHPLDTSLPSRRDGLAAWLVARDNPLTARVHVNRVWEQLFGIGLVETGEDFGRQGTLPSHPKLLDWLAIEFMDGGWSHKALCRLIVTSQTYRQASRHRADPAELDPRNRLLWRGPRFRLGAEMVRDQALAVSGLLSPQLHGPPVFPPQPDGIWQVIYSDDRWVDAEDDARYRRALYTFWRRTSPYPSMVTFDAPSRELCVSRRLRTSTPLQALVTLNDPVFVEAAGALAGRVMNETATDSSERAVRAFRLCVQRAPQTEELATLLDLYERELARFTARPDDAAALVGASRQPTDGDDLAARAAWTVVANVLLNLDETLTKG